MGRGWEGAASLVRDHEVRNATMDQDTTVRLVAHTRLLAHTRLRVSARRQTLDGMVPSDGPVSLSFVRQGLHGIEMLGRWFITADGMLHST